MPEKSVFASMVDKWPSTVVARTEIKAFTGGILDEKYCANLDCEGRGIPGRIRCGKKVVYPVDAVIRFLEERSRKL